MKCHEVFGSGCVSEFPVFPSSEKQIRRRHFHRGENEMYSEIGVNKMKKYTTSSLAKQHSSLHFPDDLTHSSVHAVPCHNSSEKSRRFLGLLKRPIYDHKVSI